MANFVSLKTRTRKTGDMVVGNTKIRFVGLQLPELSNVLREVQQQALIETAYHWRDKYGPGHFEVSAFSKYGGKEERVYELRTKNRRAMRRKRMGKEVDGDRLRPLVKSGSLRALFLHGPMKTKAAGAGTQLRVEASWPNLPRYTYYDLYGKTRAQGPKMYAELTILTEDQERELAEHFANRVQRMLDDASEGEAYV